MKNRIIIILGLLFTFLLVGCSNNTPNTKDTTNNVNTDNLCIVTFDSNGGSAVDSIKVTKGEIMTKPTDPQKTGYSLEGWYIEDEKWVFNAYTVTKDCTLVAKWAPNKYTITYDVNGGNEIDNPFQDVFYNEDFTLKTPSRDGYTFDCWMLNGEEYNEKTYTETNNITLSAKWIPNKYKITYDVNGGEELEIKTQEVLFDSNITLSEPNRLGYTFKGWLLDDKIFDSNKFTVSSDICLRACWEAKHYTLSYFNDNKLLQQVDVEYDSEVVLGANSNDVIYVMNSEFENYLDGESIIWNYTNDLDINVDIFDSLRAYRYYIKSITDEYNDIVILDRLLKNTASRLYSNYFIDGDVYVVKEIESFENCADIKEILIPNSVISISEGAFSGCSSLETITLPFTGDKRHTSTDTSQYPFGYIFGTNSYTGGTSTEQSYKTYYIPTKLNEVIITDTTYIPYGAFYNCRSLPSITIPNSVTSIGESAFSGCNSLTSITIPNSVTSIGGSAFYNCSSLENVYYNGTISNWCNISFENSESNPMVNATKFYNLDENGEVYHNGKKYTLMTLITELIIPDEVTHIGNYQFYNFNRLTSITIPEGVTSIGERAFYNCSSLTSITIPEGVTSIGYGAFYNCSSLTNITIPNSVTSIGGWAFEGCSSLESITLPFTGDKRHISTDTYQYPFGYIFGTISYTGGTSTKQYYYGSSSSSTTNSTYYIPTKLKEVIITDTTYIPYGTFYNCSSLTSITIPDSVTSIKRSTFYNCSSLTSITIPEGTTSIGESAFSGCSSLTSITIPEGAKSIEYYAFSGCSSLTSITIPEGVTSIGGSAFSGCSSLTSITIPEGVTSIGGSTFYNCSSLKTITIKEGVTSIGERAFYNCSSLTSIKIPEGVTSIGYGAFYNCSSLTSITIPEGVTSIDAQVFSGCSSLPSITIPNTVTSIVAGTFGGCSSLESITLPFTGDKRHVSTDTYQYPFGYIFGTSSYTGGTSTQQYYYGSSSSSITYSTYYIPTRLKEVIITDSTYIPHGTFYNCSSLTSITIPNSVTSIGGSAFYNCSSLTSITIPEGVTSMGSIAFYNCRSLTSIIFTGTKAQWNAISKGSSWKNNVPATKVICSDGEVAI